MSFYGRITTNIISHYFKGYWEDAQNHRPTLQAVMKRGNVETGIAGQNLVWNFRAARYNQSAYSELQTIDIARVQQYAQANLPWAFLTMSDAISRDEIAMASGDQALIRHDKEMLKNMTSDFESRINYELLNTNGATATGNVLYGLPTLWQSNTYSGKDGTIGSSTYAGQSLVLNGITSVASPEADAWTPKAVNAPDAAWAATGTTWADTCLEVLPYTEDKVKLGQKQEEQADICILTRGDYSALKSAITAQQRLIVNTSPEAAPTGLGIPGGVVFGGLEVFFDADCPASTGYVLNANQIWMEILPKPGIASAGPKMPGSPGGNNPEYFEVLTQEDIRTNGLAVRVNFRSQFRFNPRYHALIKTA